MSCEQDVLEEKLREDFLKCLRSNPQGDVVDDLIKVLKRDYVLLFREPLYCSDCISCNEDNIMISNGSPFYCMRFQRRVVNEAANNCKHYLGGGESARRSMARFHNELTGDLFCK